MPKHTTVNPERVQELEDKGGLRPDTLKKRAKALEDLDGFLKENQQISLDDALTNPGFELFLMQYFESLRVEVKDQNGVLREICPKANTLCSIKSSLKMAIKKKTTGKIDILNKAAFPRLNQVLKGVHKGIKQEGRGETDHWPPIKKHDLQKIFSFISLITRVIEARGQPEFFSLVAQIPKKYRLEYHRLSIFFIVKN